MTRQWGASGVAQLGPGLSTRTKEDIKRSVFDCCHQTSCPEELFVALDRAAGLYQAHVQVKALSLPAAVRKHLKRTLDASLRLNDRLNELDGNSRELLSEVTRGGEDLNNGILSVYDNLSPIINALNKAYILAKQYPLKGDLPRDHRRWLARDIADALREHLKIDLRADVITGTKGAFISILSLVFEEVATGEKIDFRKLAQDALALDVKSAGQGGLTRIIHDGRMI